MNEHEMGGPPMSRKPSGVAAYALAVIFVIGFSLASYVVWDFGFQHAAGYCIGPVCIKADN